MWARFSGRTGPYPALCISPQVPIEGHPEHVLPLQLSVDCEGIRQKPLHGQFQELVMTPENSNIIQFSTGKVERTRHSVLLVDDQETFRNIARNQLGHDETFQIVGEADNGSGAIELTEQLHPSVIVMDIQMPDMSGIEAARKILREDPSVRIVLTSMGDDMEYEPLAREIGACGFIPKRELSPTSVHKLIDDFLPPAGTARMAA